MSKNTPIDTLQEFCPFLRSLHLQELTIAGNRLQKIPDEISKLKNLKKLQAAGNLLQKLPDTIVQLTNLQV